MAEPLMLVAASGLAREVAVAVRVAGVHRIVGLLDDDPSINGIAIAGAAVLGGTTDAAGHPGVQFIICAGSGRVRESIVARLRLVGIDDSRFASVVHPSAVVPEGTSIGVGSILLANVVLTADVRIGKHVVGMPNVVLTHDDVVCDFATLCAGTVLGGGVTVGKRAYLGMNSCVRENRSIGNDAILGMGAVAVTDVPADQTWAGVPAHPLHAPPVVPASAAVSGAHP